MKRRRGQSVFELVIVIPIFLMICFCVITFGLLIYSKILVVTSASQGARVGAQIWLDPHLSQEEKEEKVKKTAEGVLSSGKLSENRTVEISEVEQTLYVTVRYEYKIILPIVSGLFNDNAVGIAHTAAYYIEGS